MAVVVQAGNENAPAATVEESPWTARRLLRWVLGVELVLLLAFAQLMFAGYRLGVGNQSIQIPFLKHWMDSRLYANDPMVRETLADYPSYFFRLLAIVVPEGDVYSAYFWLHVVTTAGVIGAAYGLGRVMFKGRASAVVLVLLMLAGHHRALAGDDLYSVGFTHTWAVFPLAIWAMGLFYKQWYVAAFALVGVIFNLHALTAGYLLAMFLTWAAFDYRPIHWRRRLTLMIALFAVIASPTILEMLRHHQQFGAEWLARTRIRSADHSFPTSWWTTGSSDIPRFLLLLGLAALSLSFPAARTGNRRKSLLLALGIGILFVIGLVFTEIWPIATVVRAQLYRSSRLLVVLMLAHIAHGIVAGWRLGDLRVLWRNAKSGPWRGSSDEPFVSDAEGGRKVSVVGRLLEVVLATATFVCVAVPGLLSVAPWLLLGAIAVAVFNARLGTWQAVAASVALLVVAAAHESIEYHVPGIDGDVGLDGARRGLAEAGQMLWLALAVAACTWVILRARLGPRALTCCALAVLYPTIVIASNDRYRQALAGMDRQDPWVGVQLWAEKNTRPDALFLTPTQPGGFRVYSDRSVVCEWRDGTQLYFSADYARDWWDKLTAIGRVVYDPKSSRELMRGKSLERMSDREIETLAKSYGANYVVLPAGQTRELNQKYGNKAWAVYEPRVLDEQDAFIENVCLPNIEKYRKSDARLELSDADGRTITDGKFDVTQTRQAFGFGASIPFFQEPVGDSGQDFEPPPVTPRELELFKAVFNYSVIPFSAKWQRIEPNEGERHYEELDKYVDWCTKNGVTMEFHYLSGFIPHWARNKSNAELREAWMRHCRETVARYHDRIKFWQVMNDRYMRAYAADVFKEIHAKYPDLKLGISDCSQFYSPYTGAQAAPALMQGSSEIELLQGEGAKIDFFSSHGHKPMGAWPDMRQVYECLDEFAKYGIKIHISEATLDLGARFMSPVKQADHWTPELIAEFYEKYYTVLFSHPAMEAINYWDLGPSIVRPSSFAGAMIGGTGQAGLLDPSNGDAPRPLYYKLKELIRDRWMTRLSGHVGRDGVVAFRGFHGDYDVTVTTPAGKVLRGRFTIKPDSPNNLQLRLTEETGSVATTGR